MPEFILDSSGTVHVESDDLDAFTGCYIEALFFTNQSCIAMAEWHTDESRERVREGQADGDLPHDAGFSDLHPDALAEIMADCAKFQADAAALLEEAFTRNYDAAQAGRDFWFTRNGHGVGFWDRDELEEHGSPRLGELGWDACAAARDESLGKKLSAVAESFGEVDPWFSEVEEPGSATGYGFVYHLM